MSKIERTLEESLVKFINKINDLIEEIYVDDDSFCYININGQTFKSTNLYRFYKCYSEISESFVKHFKGKAVKLIESKLNKFKENESGKEGKEKQ